MAARPPKPAKVPQCFACLAILDDKAIALDGGSTLHVCMKCWRQLPKYRRIQLRMMATSVDQGGIGIRDFLERFMRVMDRAEDENGPSIFPHRN